MRYRTWHEEERWLLLVDASEDRRRRQITRRIVVLNRTDGRHGRTDETHRVGVYARSWILDTLRSHGFAAVVRARYGAAPLPRRRLVFVAHRNGDRTAAAGPY